MVGFPQTQKQHDTIFFIMDRLIESDDIIPVKSTYIAEYYTRIFITDIVCRYGIPLSVISDMGAQFASMYWMPYQKGLGTTVKLRTAFHPLMDGQTECTQILQNSRALARA